MNSIPRRDVLLAAGSGITASLAGCLGRLTSGRGPDDTTTDGGNGPDDGNGTDDGDGESDSAVTDYETVQYAASSGAPDWFEESGDDVGQVLVVDSDDRLAVLEPTDAVAPDRREDVTDFLAATSFDDSILLYVASVGPDTCHDRVEVSDVAVTDGELTATASVVDTSGEDEACGEALTFPSTLVRVTFHGEPTTDAAVTVVDGWENQATVTATASDSLAPDPADLDGYVEPDGDPPHVPDALDCDDETVTRLSTGVADGGIQWGEATDEDGTATLALRVDEREVELGDTVAITMTNLTDTDQYTGNRHKYSIEIHTTNGWQDVRVAPDGQPPGYTDEAIVHGPGEGFRWTFELTPDGLIDGHANEETLSVCPDLHTGRYQFVFWEPAVAGAFDVTGSS